MAARDLVQEVIDALVAASSRFGCSGSSRVEFTPGTGATLAKYADDFQTRFTDETGEEFTPRNFERWRNAFLDEADFLVAVRTAMSESTAVEIGRFTQRHRDGWDRCFILLADTREAALRTTLLQNAVVIPFATRDGRLADPSALRQAIENRIFGSPHALRMRNDARSVSSRG